MRRQRELEQFLLNMPIKRLRGTTWQYYDIAPASGYTEAMIVLHGGGVRPEVMYEYILGLAQGFRVIAPRFPEVFSEIDDYVAGIFLIMRHENVKKSHFFGVGFGSVVGLHFLYRHPSRVLSSSLAHCSLPNEHKIRHVEKAFKRAEINNGPLSRLMSGSNIKPKDIEEHVFDLSLGERDMWVRNFKNFGATKQAVFSHLETLLDYNTHFSYSSSDFEKWEGKMLLIESEDDEYFDSENFSALKQLFSNCTPYCISNCGHLYSFIRGKLIVDVILRFVLDEDAYKDVTSKADISPRNSEHDNSSADEGVFADNSDKNHENHGVDADNSKKKKRESNEPDKKSDEKKKKDKKKSELNISTDALKEKPLKEKKKRKSFHEDDESKDKMKEQI